MTSVCLSAGHHPARQGATYNGLTEYKEAVVWVDELATRLSEDVHVYLVPTGPLRDKVEFINKKNPALALEIHFNSAVNSKGINVGRGSETLYYPGSPIGKRYAEVVQKNLAKPFPPDRGAKAGWYQMRENGVPDYFLKACTCPSLIIEPEFIHRHAALRTKKAAGVAAIAEAVLEILTHIEGEEV